jgi:CubicO group peptidase (beta-lactamase class C family)
MVHKGTNTRRLRHEFCQNNHAHADDNQATIHKEARSIAAKRPRIQRLSVFCRDSGLWNSTNRRKSLSLQGMRRRTFLTHGTQAALGFSLIPMAGCARRNQTAVKSNALASWHPLVADFEAQIPKLLADATVPGLSIAVIHDARLVWRRGFGFKDAATKVPVDNDTGFEAASMSKPVFAYVALKLCEKGVIGLDTPLAKYAPEPFLTGDARLELITPRHVLSHSSGFPNWRSQQEPMKIHFAPGSQYNYSGEAYYYLQSVITHLQGRVNRNDCAKFEADLEVCATDIAEFMTRNILAPFGMGSSGYIANDTLARHAATPHDQNGNPLPKSQSTGPAAARYAAAGGLHTTPTDYARFMIEVLNPKKPDTFRLKKETIDEMLRPHVKVVNGPYTSSWALGWQVQDNGLINHGGDNKGFHCHAIASPKTKSGFLVMTNGDNGPKIIQQLFARPTLDPFFGIPPQSA